MRANVTWLAVLGLSGLLFAAHNSNAGDRLAWTGGVTPVEGAAGGGLVPWALIGGLGTADEIGASGFFTYVSTSDFALHSGGVNFGLRDRVEVSYARERFDAGSVIPGLTLSQDIAGLKVKVAGDAVFAPDAWLPQVSAGVLYKHTMDFDPIPRAVGARTGADVEVYVAATKLYFAAVAGRNLIVDFTLRRTRANQFGLLGFGGDRRSAYSYEPEGSIGLFLTRDILLGGEYRSKPSDLGAFREDAAHDIFVAWNPLKPVTVTLAYVNLGHIAGKAEQRGVYASLWAGF